VHIGEAAFADPEGQHPRDADQTWEMARAIARNLMNTAFEQPINGARLPLPAREHGQSFTRPHALSHLDLSGQRRSHLAVHGRHPGEPNPAGVEEGGPLPFVEERRG
jgi:hypothetical protein